MFGPNQQNFPDYIGDQRVCPRQMDRVLLDEAEHSSGGRDQQPQTTKLTMPAPNGSNTYIGLHGSGGGREEVRLSDL
eukprot:1006887-Pelagomonas_calceolata.AAC.8